MCSSATLAAESISPISNSSELAQTQEERKAEADRLYQLGIEQSQVSQFREAVQSWEAALQTYREIGDRNGEANSLRNLGGAYSLIGEYQRAIELFEQSLAMDRESRDRNREATSIMGLGIAYFSQGEYERAIELFEQSFAVYREIGNAIGEAAALGNLGNAYSSLGQYERAIDFAKQSLALKQETADVLGEINALGNLGNAYSSLGQYERAINFYEQSLALALEIGNRNGEANSLMGLGNAFSYLGEDEKALELFDRSLAIYQEIGNRNGEANSLHNLGATYRSLKQYERARELYQQSLVITREVGDLEGEATSLGNLGIAYFFLEQYEQATEAFFASIEIYESLRDEDFPDADKIALFDIQTSPYNFLQRSLVTQGQIEQALEISERGRARAFVSLLAQKRGLHRVDEPLPPPSAQQIRQLARQENTTLVQYSVVSCDRLFAWVIQPSGTIDFREIDLNSLDDSFGDFIERSRKSVGIRGCDLAIITVRPSQEEIAARQTRHLQQLHQLLIEPIADLLPSNPEAPVVFIPHQSLFLVPFPALINADGEYLIQNHTILTAPSIQVLELTGRVGAFHVAQRKGPSPLQDVLIVGNPTMPSIWNPNTDETQRLSNLPGAQSEAVAIAELFDTQPLLGDDATETSITERMSTAQIIHLATHGLLDYGIPEETGVRDFPGAIALGEGNGEDGLLTSAELLEMNLNAELVVLSACDTGRGQLSSDGVIGLSRALIGAGVESVMVSLWAIPDAPTADLMVEFYRQWQGTGNKAQALRQAMLTTIETHPEPRNWAAFTLMGQL